MANKVYIVEDRQFRTESDYNRALHDKNLIEEIRGSRNLEDVQEIKKLLSELGSKKYRFMTILGQDFREELEEKLKRLQAQEPQAKKKTVQKRGWTVGSKAAQGSRNRGASTGSTAGSGVRAAKDDAQMEKLVEEELRRRTRRRRLVIIACSLAAVLCLGYFGFYTYQSDRTRRRYEEMAALRELSESRYGDLAQVNSQPSAPVIHYTDQTVEIPDVLPEYIDLYNQNRKLIGWLKFADKDIGIDYPVMQTSDNEYYLSHNTNQQSDKNGAIFMDKDCDVLEPSTNFIIYGHHMRSGRMFGNLDKYESEDYYWEHPTFQFDTIYEKGIYEIMYVFRSHVYSEVEIAFKYYQFINAYSEQEFDSYMAEMAAMSLYDTGVTASYGDQLVTLSTCDSSETNGRFVVVAKKIA